MRLPERLRRAFPSRPTPIGDARADAALIRQELQVEVRRLGRRDRLSLTLLMENSQRDLTTVDLHGALAHLEAQGHQRRRGTSGDTGVEDEDPFCDSIRVLHRGEVAQTGDRLALGVREETGGSGEHGIENWVGATSVREHHRAAHGSQVGGGVECIGCVECGGLGLRWFAAQADAASIVLYESIIDIIR